MTACLDRAETLGSALGSLAMQTHPAIEHVVQDGGSRDGTLALLRDQALPGARIESAPDAGLYHALNRGIARATGDVVGVLHSDDLLARPDVLARVAARLAAEPALDGVYGDLDYVAADGSGRVIRRWRAGAYDPARLAEGWMPPHPTLFLRRAVYEDWGAYDTRLRISADYEAVLRWLVRGRIRLGYLPEILVRMRAGGTSNGTPARLVRRSAEDLRALRRHGAGGVRTLLAKKLSKLGQFGLPA